MKSLIAAATSSYRQLRSAPGWARPTGERMLCQKSGIRNAWQVLSMSLVQLGGRDGGVWGV